MSIGAIIILLIKYMVSTVFITSSLGDFKNMNHHYNMVRQYRVLPEKLVKYFSNLEVVIKFVCSLLLLLGVLQKQEAIIFFILLFSYTTAIIFNLLKGRSDLSCGCGGVLGDFKISWRMVSRNLILMFFCLILYVYPLEIFNLFHTQTDSEIIVVTSKYLLLVTTYITFLLIWLLFVEVQRVKSKLKSY